MISTSNLCCSVNRVRSLFRNNEGKPSVGTMMSCRLVPTPGWLPRVVLSGKHARITRTVAASIKTRTASFATAGERKSAKNFIGLCGARYVRRLTNEMDFPVPSCPRCSGGRQRSATMRSANSHSLTWQGRSIGILYVDIDLAKNVFAVTRLIRVASPSWRAPLGSANHAHGHRQPHSRTAEHLRHTIGIRGRTASSSPPARVGSCD